MLRFTQHIAEDTRALSLTCFGVPNVTSVVRVIVTIEEPCLVVSSALVATTVAVSSSWDDGRRSINAVRIDRAVDIPAGYAPSDGCNACAGELLRVKVVVAPFASVAVAGSTATRDA
jgi:hypothetical protein